MESQDDPEARIRDLERPLSDQARWSELGGAEPQATRPYPAELYPPPPPMTGPLPPMPPPAPYPGPVRHPGPGFRGVGVGIAAVLVVGTLAAAGIVWFWSSFNDVATIVDAIEETPPALPSIKIEIPPIAVPDIDVPGVGSPASPEPPVAPGAVVSVSGVGSHRVLACQGGDVSVSGVDNVVELSGNCGSVTVSGVRNQVRAETVGVIGVSGFENTISYRAGTPEISHAGSGNSVQRG